VTTYRKCSICGTPASKPWWQTVCNSCFSQHKRLEYFLKKNQKEVEELELEKMAKKNEEGIVLGPMPDAHGYHNRIGIKSESSNRIYVVSERDSDGEVCCSCMAGKSRKMCKHIKERKGIKLGNSFLDGYKTYEGSKGSPEEWKKAFGASKEKKPEALLITGRRFKDVD
jgi:hypothetical protein